MITFETQEEFEQAVLEVMKNYLGISTEQRTDNYTGDYTKIKLWVNDEVVSWDTI